MFREDRDHIDILIGLVVVAAVVAMFVAVARGRSGIPQAARTDNAAPSMPAHPHSARGTVSTQPQSALQSNVIATVFECERHGQRVLSDQPCGDDAILRKVSEPNSMQAQDTSNLYAPVPTSFRQPSTSGSSGGVTRPNAAECASIEQRINSIDARMRRKYTSTQGEYFRGELRDLRNQRWDAGCRWLKSPG
jgi:hypothetical protein